MDLNAIKNISERIATQLNYECQSVKEPLEMVLHSWIDQKGIVISLNEASILVNAISEFDNVISLLEEIAEAKGSYDTDKLTHCSNTVRDMVKLAQDALLKFQIENRANRKGQSPAIISTFP